MAAAPPSLGTQIREELTCSICLELFTRPKVLPCQHTFCQGCLQDLAGRGGPFQCPNCRQQVELPPQEVAGLPDSHIIANLCEMLQTQARLSEETREQPQQENRCSFHPSEEVKLYCEQCHVPVCVDCVEEGHDGHPTTGLKRALQRRKALVAEGRNILEKYISFIIGLRDEEGDLDDQKQQTDSKIEKAYQQACNQIHQRLTEEKERLLSLVETKYKQNKGAVQNYRDGVLSDVAELSYACDAAEEAMFPERQLRDETNLAEVVQRYQDVTIPYLGQCKPAVFHPRALDVKELLGRVEVPSAAAGKQTQTVTYERLLTFGKPGTGSGQLSRPHAVAVSTEGEIFVANIMSVHIQVFTMQGGFICQIPTALSERMGPREPDSIDPIAMTMNDEGKDLVVMGVKELTTGYVVVYTKQGFLVGMPFSLKHTGWRGVAMHGKNRILISQTTGNDMQNIHGEVQVFDTSGKHVGTVGRSQGMKDPHYITVSGEGNILVSDKYNHCVFVYNEDGKFLFKFGGMGSGGGQLKEPGGICTDRAGNIIVADSGNKRVELFDKTGRFLKHITTDMKKPCAVAMAPQGQLVVTDIDGNTITIFGTNSLK
ncbi:tripartite motif-containing protein 2-like [Branchiostoma floridae]|uniref:RING-type E3 ubiquitin transferase n=1 Tax=Branchiostoma floridae TaxID=7739 RepID=C3ZG94_BRAFL|nr:tripartite motif-containing protein 2-like [Branchiostoma floridae]|eukprot:XP_002592404.1 hypothetical protein BRAFLDRAFT_67269 [Branchiostoma floridae]